MQLVDNSHEGDGDFLALYSWSEGGEDIALSYCNVAEPDLEERNWGDISGADGNFGEDPLYSDVSSSDPAAWDLGLSTGSPAIDAGDPLILDEDGTTSDMGAYGGPAGASW